MSHSASLVLPPPARVARVSNTRGLIIALLAALFAHLILILGVRFERPTYEPPDNLIEVVLVRTKGPEPVEPDPNARRAQVSRAGSATAPIPESEPDPQALSTPPEPQPEPEIDEQPVAEPPPEPVEPVEPPTPTQEPPPPAPEPVAAEPAAAENTSVLTATVTEPDPLFLPPLPTTPKISAANILASRDQEIAELAERIRHQTHTYASRKRRKAVSASTREYKYASYLEGWRRKVERIGNLNYPEAAKERGLYGNLILNVSIRADGSVERIRVVQSSGHKVLDQAAVNIVKLASPFAPLPPEIREEADILDVTRTWQFKRNNQLGWDN